MSLRDKGITGVRWSAVGKVVSGLTQAIRIGILTSILAKGDFGLLAMATVFIGYVVSISDLGLGAGIIHRKENSQLALASTYWIGLGLGCAAYIGCFLGAGAVAAYYGEPEVAIIFQILGLRLVFVAIGSQFSALLTKHLQFKQLAWIQIGNEIGVTIASIALAYSGFGVFALVYGSLVGAAIAMVLRIIWGLKIWRPSLQFSFSEARWYLKVGLLQLAERLLYELFSQVDILLIGPALGKDAVGLYSMAKQIVMIPASRLVGIFTGVSFPLFSILQDNVPKLRDAYSRLMHVLSGLTLPIYAILFLEAPFIVNTYLGPEWVDAITPVRWFTLMAIARGVGSQIGPILKAKGRFSLATAWVAVMVLLIAIPMYLAAQSGVDAAARTYSLVWVLTMVAGHGILVRLTIKHTFTEAIRAIWKPVLIVGISLALAWLVRSMLMGAGVADAAVFVASAGTIVLGFASLSYAWDRELIDLGMEFLSIGPRKTESSK